MKPTLVLGASTNPERYSYMATAKLKAYGHKVYPVGIKKGSIEGLEILTDKPVPTDVDTITMYLSDKNQKEWYDYIFALKPKRIVFNPGAENTELENLATAKGIEVVNACTLVMLSIGNY
jgi:predicted CoA-binding protein